MQEHVEDTRSMPCQVSLYTEPLTAMKKTRTVRFVKDREHVKHWALLFEFYELEIRRGIVIELYRDGGKVNSNWREVPLGEMKDVTKIELFKKDIQPSYLYEIAKNHPMLETTYKLVSNNCQHYVLHFLEKLSDLNYEYWRKHLRVDGIKLLEDTDGNFRTVASVADNVQEMRLDYSHLSNKRGAHTYQF